MQEQPDLATEAKLKKQRDNWKALMYVGIGMFGVGTFMLIGQSVSKDMPFAIIIAGIAFIGMAVYKLYQIKPK